MGDGQRPTEGDSRLRGTREPDRQATDVRAPRSTLLMLNGGAGLKEYSCWPTYPQLYIRGELVGGVDIVKELVGSGEFVAMLPADESSASLNDRLQQLTRRDRVMLFMKGTPDQPRCGFSRTMVALLNDKQYACMCQPAVDSVHYNNNSHDNVYGAVIMTKVIARVRPVHLMNVD